MDNFWQKLKKPILALAPMAGVTDSAFRLMCKLGGADVLYTEFVSTDAIVYESQKTFKMLKFSKKEKPLVVQIFGKNPEHYFKSVKVLSELGYDGIDINFGCPANKVVKSGGGVKLMHNLSLVRELVQAACEGGQVPISLKVRASIEDKKTKIKVTALDLVEKVKDLPIAAIMVHGRSYEQPFDGELDVSAITQVKRAFQGIVLANGGIYRPEDAKTLLEQTGADGVGIARGAWGKTWLFSQIKDYLKTGKYEEFSWEKVKKQMLEHAKYALTNKGEHGLVELRKQLAWYVKGMPNAASLRSLLVKTSSIEEIEAVLKN
ncbi:MAG: tRNA-dihydrouridine synthase [Patescibacteria group bacterium]|jgi:tRNA-dihydrouridine synthase B